MLNKKKPLSFKGPRDSMGASHAAEGLSGESTSQALFLTMEVVDKISPFEAVIRQTFGAVVQLIVIKLSQHSAP